MTRYLRELTLLWKRFSPLEERLLAEVRRVLPAPALPIFDAQVKGINHVQRLPPTWAEIDFYRLRRFRKVDWSGIPRFPCTDESPLADVRFRAAGKRFKATLSCIDGFIFAFAVTPGPRRVAFLAWDDAGGAALLGDPLRAPTGLKEPEVLPAVWRDFLEAHPGGPPMPWTWYDERSAYRVALDDGVYLILAEKEGPQLILQRVEPLGDRLFYLADYDGDPEPLTQPLEALMKIGAQRADEGAG